MSACLICLAPVDDGEYHAPCLRRLFRTGRLPDLDFEVAKLHTVGLAMAGRTSMTGIQRKLSLSLSADRKTLQVATDDGRYILKPQSSTFPQLPENEHVTMLIADAAGISIPPCGLVRLKDGSAAFISRRFDRPDVGGKLRQEDFCQLALRRPIEKFDGSAELLARLCSQFASEPGVELIDLYRRLVFAWWTGNGDMHLKNFSLLETDGRFALSPAYDLLSTRLVLDDFDAVLPVGGKQRNLTRRTWREFAAYCRIQPRAADGVIRAIVGATDAAVLLVGRSLLSQEARERYQALIRERTAVLAG